MADDDEGEMTAVSTANNDVANNGGNYPVDEDEHEGTDDDEDDGGGYRCRGPARGCTCFFF